MKQKYKIVIHRIFPQQSSPLAVIVTHLLHHYSADLLFDTSAEKGLVPLLPGFPSSSSTAMTHPSLEGSFCLTISLLWSRVSAPQHRYLVLSCLVSELARSGPCISSKLVHVPNSDFSHYKMARVLNQRQRASFSAHRKRQKQRKNERQIAERMAIGIP